MMELYGRINVLKDDKILDVVVLYFEVLYVNV